MIAIMSGSTNNERTPLPYDGTLTINPQLHQKRRLHYLERLTPTLALESLVPDFPGSLCAAQTSMSR